MLSVSDCSGSPKGEFRSVSVGMEREDEEPRKARPLATASGNRLIKKGEVLKKGQRTRIEYGKGNDAWTKGDTIKINIKSPEKE